VSLDVVLDGGLSDPDFLLAFDVERNTQTVGNDGLAAFSSTLTMGVLGVVTPMDTRDMYRFEVAEVVSGAITIYTRFRLLCGEGVYDSDVVIFQNQRYTVKKVADFSAWGVGYVMALCFLLPVAP